MKPDKIARAEVRLLMVTALIDKKKVLVNQVIEYMISYLLSGSVNPKITEGLKIEESKALNFNTALKIRFLLDEETTLFLQEIEKSLRNIRTEITREREATRGEIKGRIDWKNTIQSWASTAFRDRTLITVSKPIKDYDIPENLVLKKTVSLLFDLMNDPEVEREIDSREYTYIQGVRKSRGYIKGILKNVHFRKIMDPTDIKITPRMKTQVKQSRSKLYRDSCKVLEKYENVFFKHEFGELLNKTFIDPENEDKMFELFCLFTIIDTFLKENQNCQIERLVEITQERKETAVLRLNNNYTLNIYYNVTANLSFYDRPPEPQETAHALKEITVAYFGQEKKVTTRRPDIIIELVHENQVVDCLVFEIKNTDDVDYIVEGISQTLHYMYALQKKGESNYFFENTLGRGYNAGVVSYKLPREAHNNNALMSDQNLKVKLMDYGDFIDRKNLNLFLSKFLEQNGLQPN